MLAEDLGNVRGEGRRHTTDRKRGARQALLLQRRTKLVARRVTYKLVRWKTCHSIKYTIGEPAWRGRWLEH
jgi:hypothetical protein